MAGGRVIQNVAYNNGGYYIFGVVPSNWDVMSKEPIRLACFFLVFSAIVATPPEAAKKAAPDSYRSGNSYPITYRIGKLDPRFGISKSDFIDVCERAKSRWEKALGRSLFVYDATARFTVNLIFDKRQERTIQRRKIQNRMDSRGRSYNRLLDQHSRLLQRKSELEAAYDHALADFNEKTDAYNADVSYWNKNGGAPEDKYSELQRTKTELEEEQRGLEKQRRELNTEVKDLNELSDQINQLADKNNLDVILYNGQFVHPREFEQGLYDGKGINIYEFDKQADLEIVLIHEFGHALGLLHAKSPTAIMFYRFEKQDLGNIHLTEDDKTLLKQRFHLN